MVGLQTRAAHGDEAVGRPAVELAVAEIGGVVAGRGVLAVDALRGKRKYWYLMAISFVCSTVIATLLYINPFASESAAWIFMGVSLIITAALDVIYFVLRKQESK